MRSGKIRLSREIAFFYSVITFGILFSSLLMVKTLAVKYTLLNYSEIVSNELSHPLNMMFKGGKAKMTKLFQKYTIVAGKEFLSDPYELKGKIVMPASYPSMVNVNGVPYVFVKIGKMNGKDFFAISPAYQLQALINTLSSLTVVLSVVGAFLVVVIGVVFSTTMLKPLKKLSRELQNVKDLKSYSKLSEQNSIEFQELVDSLNSMLLRLKDGFERQEQFVSDASHELKTPLTALLANIDMLLRWGMKDEKILVKSLKDMKISLKRLQKLVNSLLELSKSESKMKKKTFDLREVAEELAEEVKMIHPNFEVKVVGRGKAFSDPEKVKVITHIFLDNAFKYSQNMPRAIVHVSDGKIEVEDFGIGMSEKNLKHIFDRFYRADPSRTNEGFGLGLSIAKKLADVIEARINVRSEAGKGSVFTLDL